MMGVDNSEPYTPPLLMVKVPPAMSSMLMVPSRAFLPSALIVWRERWAEDRLLLEECQRNTMLAKPMCVLRAR